MYLNRIALDGRDVTVIAGTNLKVQELVAERLAWGWSPEEMLLNHSYLTLGQIFSALAYYADHQAAIEAAILADVQLAEGLRRQASSSPLLARLKMQGLA